MENKQNSGFFSLNDQLGGKYFLTNLTARVFPLSSGRFHAELPLEQRAQHQRQLRVVADRVQDNRHFFVVLHGGVEQLKQLDSIQ
jgi:hypothetical protein